MKFHSSSSMYKPSVSAQSSAAASSKAAEEQTSEMVSNLTMTQLLYILHRIQQLSFHSPDHAKELLNQNPQLSLALIHAQYLVCGNQIESGLLPLGSEELKVVKERLNQIRLAETNPTAVSRESLIGTPETVTIDVGLSRKFQKQVSAPNDQVTELTKLLSDLDPQTLAKVMESITAVEDSVVDVESLVQGLLNLSAEQIAALPESVQRQVLKLLEESITT
jgi:hypothetical protein